MTSEVVERQLSKEDQRIVDTFKRLMDFLPELVQHGVAEETIAKVINTAEAVLVQERFAPSSKHKVA